MEPGATPKSTKASEVDAGQVHCRTQTYLQQCLTYVEPG